MFVRLKYMPHRNLLSEISIPKDAVVLELHLLDVLYNSHLKF